MRTVESQILKQYLIDFLEHFVLFCCTVIAEVEWVRLFDLEVVRRLEALKSSVASLDLPSLMKMEHGGSNNNPVHVDCPHCKLKSWI